jgi:hypothetical protein
VNQVAVGDLDSYLMWESKDAILSFVRRFILMSMCIVNDAEPAIKGTPFCPLA